MKSVFSRRSVLTSALATAANLLPALARGQTRVAVTIANAAGNLNLAMQELMKQQGFLEEFGLEPNVMNVADGSKIVGGILGGGIDASMMSGFGQAFPAIEKGGKLKILAGAAMLPSLAVFTSKPYVRTLKDLEGRTVGTGSLGALLHQLMVALLRKNGVDVGKVRFVNIGSSVDVFRALSVGTIDAGTGEVAMIEQVDSSKIRLVEKGNMSVELPEYTYQGAWTSDRLIQQRRDVLVRALAAYAKLYRFVQAPAAKDAFLKARRAALPSGSEADATAQWDYVQAYKPFAVDLILSDERLRYMQQLNMDLGVQSRVLPFDQVADMSLAREALALLKA